MHFDGHAGHKLLTAEDAACWKKTNKAIVNDK